MMLKADIIEAIEKGMERIIYREWKHEYYVDGMYSDKLVFVVDGIKYSLKLEEANQ